MVISAGTSDIPVAEEAAVCAEAFGNRVSRLYDVGVAGLHRLTDSLEVREGVLPWPRANAGFSAQFLGFELVSVPVYEGQFG
jgi:hypothetical protein